MPRSPLHDPALIRDVLSQLASAAALTASAWDRLSEACQIAVEAAVQYADEVAADEVGGLRAEALSDPWWDEVQKVVQP